MNKKLILLDIDGTLYDNKNKRVPSSTIEAIKMLSKKMKIAIATGRAGFMLSSINEILPYADYLITINGQYISSKEKVLYDNPIPLELIKNIVNDMINLKIAYGFEGNQKQTLSKIDEKVLDSFNGLGIEIPSIDKDFYKNNNIYQLWTFTSWDVANYLEEKNPYFRFIRWLNYGFDILPKEASKGLGMKHLLEILKIDVDEVIAIGDGDNDYELIRDAGLGIAMGNATPLVKEVSDYITDDVSNNGLYKALKHFQII